VSNDVSEEHIASIYRVEKQAEQETSVNAGGKQNNHRYENLRSYIVITCFA
jgi:hypothetical protein